LLVGVAASLAFTPQKATAQQHTGADSLSGISMKEAVKKAKAHYPSVRAARLKIENRKALKKTAWDLGTTRIFTGKDEVGNGLLGTYTEVGIAQEGIDLFGIIPERRFHKKQVTLARSALDLTLLEVEREVRKAWGNAYVAKRKYMLYQQLDSVFASFERAA